MRLWIVFVIMSFSMQGKAQTEYLPLWEEHIDAFLPPRISIPGVPWNEFLSRWNDEAIQRVRTRILALGYSSGATEDQIRASEKLFGIKIPREIYNGGVRFPGVTDEEQAIAAERLRITVETLRNIHERTPIRDYDDEVLAAEGLFRKPASEEIIRQAEQRLGVTFPPSYREFLLMTNGWILMDEYLLPVEEIDWYRNSKWKDHFEDWYEDLPDDVKDEEYFVYDSRQNPRLIPLKYLMGSLLISDAISDVRGLIFLNPQVVSQDGEWEAWAGVGAWYARFRSFADLMEQLYLRDIAYLRYNTAERLRPR